MGCKYPSIIAVEDALRIYSPLWSVLNDDIQLDWISYPIAVPYCSMRQLTDLVHTLKRCLEEIASTKEEMARMFSHFEGKLKVLDTWMYFLLALLFARYSSFYLCLFLFSFAFLSPYSAYFGVLSNFLARFSRLALRNYFLFFFFGAQSLFFRPIFTQNPLSTNLNHNNFLPLTKL